MSVTSPSETHNLDQAVDALAALLRDYGQHAFDLPDAEASATRTLCERWARHVLLAEGRPGQSGEAETAGNGKRDWAGLRAYFTEHRQNENSFVSDTLAGLQGVLWTFLRGLNHSLSGEMSADQRMQAQFDRLTSAAQGNAIDQIRKEALATIALVSRIMEERREQQRAQTDALYAQIRELDHQLRQARKESAFDPLTKLFNRKAFDESLNHALDMLTVFQEPCCLLMIDADHFKTINDTYGHTTGDLVLQQLADCLTRIFPSKGDCVARYGGEEFAVIFNDVTLSDAGKVAERLLRAVRSMRIESDGRTVPVTVSVGLADARPRESAAVWLQRADTALYRAKERGRDRLEIAE